MKSVFGVGQRKELFILSLSSLAYVYINEPSLIISSYSFVSFTPKMMHKGVFILLASCLITLPSQAQALQRIPLHRRNNDGGGLKTEPMTFDDGSVSLLPFLPFVVVLTICLHISLSVL